MIQPIISSIPLTFMACNSIQTSYAIAVFNRALSIERTLGKVTLSSVSNSNYSSYQQMLDYKFATIK